MPLTNSNSSRLRNSVTKESYALRLPHLGFIKYAGLQWSGDAADYYDNNGELAAFDPTAYEDGPSGLLLRRDLLDRYLAENGLALCWVILGEKMILGGSMTEGYQGRLKISGAYRYTTDSPVPQLVFLTMMSISLEMSQRLA